MKIKKHTSLLIVIMLLFSTISSAQAYGVVQNNKIDINLPCEVASEDGKIYDIDDYATNENCRKYFINYNDGVSSSVLSTDTKSVAKEEVVPQSTCTATATKAYTLYNVPQNTTIQKTYVGTKYIYASQIEGKENEESQNVVLSRYKINGTRADYMDKMVLKEFGHNQTLEFYTHNGKTYIWIGCKANKEWDESYYTMQIGRMQYKAGTTISEYKKILRFGSLDCANTTGRPFDTLTTLDSEENVVKRIDGALSSDKTTLALAVRSIHNHIQYSYYDNEALNDLLDEKENTTSNYVTCQNNNRVKNACLFSCVQKVGNRILPYKSCQGIDLTNAGSLYISGGIGGEYYPKIAKMIKNGNGGYTYKSCVTLSNTISGKHPEIEGVQISGNLLYFVFHVSGTGSTRYIYSIDKTIL